MENFVMRGDRLLLALNFFALMRSVVHKEPSPPWGTEGFSKDRCEEIAGKFFEKILILKYTSLGEFFGFDHRDPPFAVRQDTLRVLLVPNRERIANIEFRVGGVIPWCFGCGSLHGEGVAKVLRAFASGEITEEMLEEPVTAKT